MDKPRERQQESQSMYESFSILRQKFISIAQDGTVLERKKLPSRQTFRGIR